MLLVFSFDLLGLTSDEVLPELVLTATTFESLEQVLTIDILNHWALLLLLLAMFAIVKALKDTITRLIKINIDHCLGQLQIATFDTGYYFFLLIILDTVARFPSDHFKVGLLLAHIVDQV